MNISIKIQVNEAVQCFQLKNKIKKFFDPRNIKN